MVSSYNFETREITKFLLTNSMITGIYYETRCGYLVTVLSTIVTGNKPILGVYKKYEEIKQNGEIKKIPRLFPMQWTPEGKVFIDKRIPSDLDIVKIYEKTT